METRTEQLLYSFFVANSGAEISYQRIKNITQGIIEINGRTEHVYSALSILMRSGLVEQAQLSRYRLSPSCILLCQKFQLGVNLPSEELTRLAPYLIKSKEGLGIYQFPSYDSEIPTYDFNVKDILAKCGNIRGACDKLLNKVEERPKFMALESYDAITKKFVAQKDFLPGVNLYRIYSFSKLHFDYYFEKESSTGTFLYCRFERYDLETFNIFRAMLSINCHAVGLKYMADGQKLVVERYFPFPNTIERVLFLNSILSSGDFPEDRIYSLTARAFDYLQKIFNNKITIYHEEHI